MALKHPITENKIAGTIAKALWSDFALPHAACKQSLHSTWRFHCSECMTLRRADAALAAV